MSELSYLSEAVREIAKRDRAIAARDREIERLRALIKSACERMDRARGILTDGNPPELVRLIDGLGIAVDADTVCADPMREAMRRFTTPPRKGTPAADLAEGEKLALCIASGAPTEIAMDGGVMTVRTTVPCGVADRGDGGYIVAVQLD